jgi:hypothetical protein
MIRAKRQVEEKTNMMIQLQARINKLRTVEDKTKRNMQEAKRQADFISQIREEKAKKREERDKIAIEQASQAMISHRKIQEERNDHLKQLK